MLKSLSWGAPVSLPGSIQCPATTATSLGGGLGSAATTAAERLATEPPRRRPAPAWEGDARGATCIRLSASTPAWP